MMNLFIKTTLLTIPLYLLHKRNYNKFDSLYTFLSKHVKFFLKELFICQSSIKICLVLSAYLAPAKSRPWQSYYCWGGAWQAGPIRRFWHYWRICTRLARLWIWIHINRQPHKTKITNLIPQPNKHRRILLPHSEP